MKVDVERRRVWLSSLRKFKRGVKIRAKLGVIEHICQQVATERKGQQTWDAPQWEHDRWITLLYTSIRDDEYPTELLVGFVKTAEVSFFNPKMQPTVVSTLNAVDYVCKQLSKQLRSKFGVFI